MDSESELGLKEDLMVIWCPNGHRVEKAGDVGLVRFGRAGIVNPNLGRRKT